MKKVGEYVIYRKDVCKIKEIKENEFNHLMCYTLIPLKDETLKLTIPIESEHLRNLMSKEEMLEFIKTIKNIPVIDGFDKEIEKEYIRLLNTENQTDLVKIIKTTYERNQKRIEKNKKTSDKDNHYFEMAENYLYTEIATVLEIPYNEAKEFVIDSVK